MIQALAIRLAVCGLGVAMFAAAAAAQVTPRLWGTSYAIAMAPNTVVLGRQSAPVRVSARLPHHLQCAQVLSVERQPVDQRAVSRDPLLAAPVRVGVAPAPCRGDWRDRWADFVVPGPTGSDILDVVLVSPEGEMLMRERIAVEASTGGGKRR